MKKLLTLLALLGPLASVVLATCDVPSDPPMDNPTCASLGATIPDPNGGFDRTDTKWYWSCCDENKICTYQNYVRFRRYYWLYSTEPNGGQFSCYDTGHVYTQHDSNYGCCEPKPTSPSPID